MKKLISALMAGAMMFGLVACGGGSTASPSPSASAPAPSASAPVESASAGDVANDPKVTLVYAEVNPLDTIVGQTATAFKEKVEELSGGSITIDVQASVSRVMNAIVDKEHKKAAQALRKILAKYAEVELLVQIGEYKKGADAEADFALAHIQAVNAFLRQGLDEKSSFEETLAALKKVVQ